MISRPDVSVFLIPPYIGAYQYHVSIPVSMCVSFYQSVSVNIGVYQFLSDCVNFYQSVLIPIGLSGYLSACINSCRTESIHVRLNQFLSD